MNEGMTTIQNQTRRGGAVALERPASEPLGSDRALRFASCGALLLWGALIWVQTAFGGPPPVDLGKLLDEHPLRDLEGESVTLERGGEITVVNFWASWCTPCTRELPELSEMYRDFAPEGVQFAAISIDSDRVKAQRFVEEHAVDLPFYHDGPKGLARQLDLSSLPCTYVLDGSGKTVLVSNGSDAAALWKLETTIALLVREQEQELAGARRPSSQESQARARANPSGRNQ